MNKRNQAATYAEATVRNFLTSALGDAFKLEVVDVFAEPWRAESDHVIAVPSLVRSWPLPTRTIIGGFENRERMMHVLDLPEGKEARPA